MCGVLVAGIGLNLGPSGVRVQVQFVFAVGVEVMRHEVVGVLILNRLGRTQLVERAFVEEMRLLSSLARGAVAKVARPFEGIKNVVADREKILGAEILCQKRRVVDLDHPDLDLAAIRQSDRLRQVGQIDLGVLDQDVVRARVEIVETADKRRLVVCDIGELECVFASPAIDMVPSHVLRVRVLRDIENKPVIPLAAVHVDLAFALNRCFQDVIAAEAGHRGGVRNLNVWISMVDQMIIL